MLNSTRPFLGLYCIIRDAEKTLPNLLKSIKCTRCFDEIIFVDTGSTDRTVQILQDWKVLLPIKITHFDWIDDFSAARQFAFEQGTAIWRMYLDADDTFEDIKKLRPMLERTAREFPHNNCVSLKYEYVKGEVEQDVIRLVRWDDGWKWSDPVHEHLVPIGHPRVISKYVDVWVKHRPPDGHANRSFERNLKICERAFKEANAPHKKGLWAYYIARDFSQDVIFSGGTPNHSVVDLARTYFSSAAEFLGRNNLACDALVKWSRMEQKLGNFDQATSLASDALGRCPELHDGWAQLAIVCAAQGQDIRAAGIFDQLHSMAAPPLETQHDAYFLDALTNAWAAKAYLNANRVQDAEKALNKIPDQFKQKPEIWKIAHPIYVAVQKRDLMQRLYSLWEGLIYSAEPLKAKQLLKNCTPEPIADSPNVQALMRRMENQLKHMESWGDYQRTYAAIPTEIYHVPEKDHSWTLDQGRARMVATWAKNLSRDGEAIRVLVIGVQDGLIEAEMMRNNPRIEITVCDVAPQASTSIEKLKAEFGARVKTHTVASHHYDWIPANQTEQFDACILFEVLEHLRDTDRALIQLRSALKPDGILFLSTPIAEQWIEPYLAQSEHANRPWYHVIAHNPSSLWGKFYEAGFTGELLGVDSGLLFLAAMRKSELPLEAVNSKYPEISFYIPTIAKSFDPFSAKEGHLGGSEEAVIHLSTYLAKLGVKVTVYCEMPERDQKIFVCKGVQWRSISEFDAPSRHGVLFVWRSPIHAHNFKRSAPHLRILNWAHDTSYGVDASVYDVVDGTIALSEFHGEALKKYDGFDGAPVYAMNGVDPSEFPELGIDSERDQYRAIYAQAPNRGLDMLLELWPRIKARVPQASLRIFYDWAYTRKIAELKRGTEVGDSMTALLDHLDRLLGSMKHLDVEYVGGVSHSRLHEEFRKSGVWAYPCHTFEETFCISAVKAQASGCWPVTMKKGSIPEVQAFGDLVKAGDEDTFVEKVVDRMLNPPSIELRSHMRATALRVHSWERAANRFLDIARSVNPRITFVCGGSRTFNGASLQAPAGLAQLGGSEEAVIVLSKALAQAGREVVVYAPLPPEDAGSREIFGYAGSLTWKNIDFFIPESAHGTVILWRAPQLVYQLKNKGYPIILWLMDPHYGRPKYDYEEADRIVFLTDAHKELIQRNDCAWQLLPRSKVIHNGLDLNELPVPETWPSRRNPHAVMWATSLDRGLKEFLTDVWSKVRSEVPTAVLHIYYGLGPLREHGKSHLADELTELFKQDFSVIYHDAVSREELTKAYLSCGVFAYRSIGFEETYSIATVKAQALGCWPVVNAAGALPEVAESGSIVHSVDPIEFAKRLIHELLCPINAEHRAKAALYVQQKFSVESAVEKWLKLITEVHS